MRFLVPVAVLASTANAFVLTGVGRLITERVDPIINPGQVSSHAHALFGGSNLRITTSTALLRQSFCTSVGIKEDKSAYWFPQLYFHANDGTFTGVGGGGVVYYLYRNASGVTTPFPDDFRMISGTPTLRSYNDKSFAQQAISFLCLNFAGGTPPPFNGLPQMHCPSGIRAQINFPSCWDGKNLDPSDHKSHVAFPSEGPDKGTCSDPNYPVTLPRIFFEIYFGTQTFDISTAMDPQKPFVFAHGDPTGYGYHGDFINGWDAGVLKNVVDKCHCNAFGDAKCCEDLRIFTINKDTNCHITNTWNETTDHVPYLPGNVTIKDAPPAIVEPIKIFPARVDPVFAYLGDQPPGTGTVVGTGSTGINLPTSTSPPAMTSSPATIPPAQPTTTPVDSTPTPSPVPPVTVNQPSPPTTSGGAGPTSTPTPSSNGGADEDDGYCYSTSDHLRQKRPRGFRKRHNRRMHNAALDESF